MFRYTVFPQNASGGYGKLITQSIYTSYPNKPQEAHRDYKIGVGGLSTYLAPISLSHNPVSKYLDSPHSIYTTATSDAHRGVDYFTSVEEVKAEGALDDKEHIGFFDKVVVHLAPTSLKYHSIPKHPRRIT